jgi:hypothetical protein
MARIHDLLAALTPEQTALLPEGFVDDVTAEYDKDLDLSNAAVKERENRIAERDAIIAEKEKESIAIKAANWDMLQAIPANKKAPEDDGDEPDDEDADDDDIFGN